MMDRLTAMELFVAAIESGSLSAGARKLGRPAAAATRAVALLEADTGETLLIRSTRQIALTSAGGHWLGIWREVLGQLAAGRSGIGFGGRLVLTAPELFGRTWVQPLVEDYLRDHPRVSARLLLLTRTVDLVAEGVDLAIRVGELPENGISATRLGTVRELLCAAPAYVDRRGRPQSPADLRKHDCIGMADQDEVWRLADEGRIKTRATSVSLHLSINNAGSVLDAVLRGSGIGKVMSCQALPYIEKGDLIPLMMTDPAIGLPVHLVFRGHPPRSGSVRDFVDWAVPKLRQRLAVMEAAVAALAID